MKTENPQAFPSDEYSNNSWPDHLNQQHQGMTLRDYYAGLAMQGVLSNIELHTICVEQAEDEKTSSDKIVSELSFEMADAMLKERSKSHE